MKRNIPIFTSILIDKNKKKKNERNPSRSFINTFSKGQNFLGHSAFDTLHSYPAEKFTTWIELGLKQF